MGKALEEAGFDADKIRIAKRVAKVHSIWKELVEQAILDHTNAVYILTKDGICEMHVYVDDSIFAAELNNRRELLVMLCMKKFNEKIDKFVIHISKGVRKTVYPFRLATYSESSPMPLNEEEMMQVNQIADGIQDEIMRTKFREAMISDLQRKKGQNS